MQRPHPHPRPRRELQKHHVDGPTAESLTTKAADEGTHLTFYPAYAFKASATWLKWVKLTCLDIHTVLQRHEKYSQVTTSIAVEGNDPHARQRDPPLLLFYLNHPVQFVQVIGVVVTLEDYFEKFWLFKIDDSSGAVIDVTCPKPEEKQGELGARPSNPGTRRATETVKQQLDPRSKSRPKFHPASGEDGEATEEEQLQDTLSLLDIGTTVQAKGTLTTFRSTRQLSLLRLDILPTTTHEMALIASRTQFLSSTLSRPWVLTREEQRKLRDEAQHERADDIERAKKRKTRETKRRDREERHRQIIEKEYEKEEIQRQKEGQEARKWGEVLKGPRRKRMKSLD
ncbi:uncharacterized protein PV07_01318 [Cladophialophora immunda]|uniref:CST complex subunit Stn1 N-terminal domain-containing protein n=1 Tax=Cladophialophora immunda TaxID=569365 RepID=A0A0D2A2N5_9EURO|nr:uncharacterized protein PV07_01318 [Cladophialophora immunda]KIW34541.1 hypothetical protein PV07_01318 [Cladophialophora immunda]OQV05618.1 hypothetical protein CLAIMM_10330 [Cladophialophora immunda]